MLTAAKLIKEVKLAGDPARAKSNAWFFKTKKGEYGFGDKFAGLIVPVCRKIAKNYQALSLLEIKKLLASPIHEVRLIAVIIMTYKFAKAKDLQPELYKLYLASTKRINNWDLVDVSAPRIVGAYLIDKPRNVLFKLAKSKLLWDRRIAIISTLYFISRNDFADTVKIAEMLLGDTHDLIHKASGWMLREVGKRSLQTEKDFLDANADRMPRTMLRYSIEKFPEGLKKRYLNIKRR